MIYKESTIKIIIRTYEKMVSIFYKKKEFFLGEMLYYQIFVLFKHSNNNEVEYL